MSNPKIELGKDSSGRPLVIDARTKAKFEEACRRLGFNLTIVQGSYRGDAGAKASAGTHDGGGVIDIRTWNIPDEIGVAKVVRVLRECGFIAWYRTKAQGFDPHIHAIEYGNPALSPSAQRQVVAYERGRNGLASNGRDDGPRVNIPKEAPVPKRTYNNVQTGRAALHRALRILRQAKNRPAVETMIRRIESAMERGPKK